MKIIHPFVPILTFVKLSLHSFESVVAAHVSPLFYPHQRM